MGKTDVIACRKVCSRDCFHGESGMDLIIHGESLNETMSVLEIRIAKALQSSGFGVAVSGQTYSLDLETKESIKEAAVVARAHSRHTW